MYLHNFKDIVKWDIKMKLLRHNQNSTFSYLEPDFPHEFRCSTSMLFLKKTSVMKY